MTTRTYTRDGLAAILAAHRLWLRGEPGGVRANLSMALLIRANFNDAMLARADLMGAYLSGSDIIRANLSGADLSCADMGGADLTGADLTRANLDSADLSGADLSGADLSGADLSGADLNQADFNGANLGGVMGLPDAPIIPGIHRAILAACTADGAGLDMGNWHACATTHCRAGWAIHLAGAAGYDLEKRYGPELSGVLIYHASDPTVRIPNFGASNEEAMADMRRLAGVE